MATGQDRSTPAGAPRLDTLRRGIARSLGAAAGMTALALVSACAGPASAGYLGNLELLSRSDNRTLSAYEKDGRRWVVGTPGQEYSVRVCNSTAARVLAVTSVDGVNVVSGETASPTQSGYVLDAYECTSINGWRKNLSSVAAFYFTELPDSYAARTNRPGNVGVVGVALFRERPRQIVYPVAPPISSSSPAREPLARQEAAGNAEGKAAADSAAPSDRPAAEAAAPRRDFAGERSMPAPISKIGTGHGRQESSYVTMTRFDRLSDTPDETLAIYYDRRENLIAMGILPPPAIARSSDPFPGWTPRFVPDPPQR